MCTSSLQDRCQVSLRGANRAMRLKRRFETATACVGNTVFLHGLCRSYRSAMEHLSPHAGLDGASVPGIATRPALEGPLESRHHAPRSRPESRARSRLPLVRSLRPGPRLRLQIHRPPDRRDPRRADAWDRRRLIAWGTAFWSLMTALSGLARGFGPLALARIGVGAGEASAAPAAVLGFFSSGIFI